ncbi:cysteine-rich RLK (RECEPTOR-like protein kinase) 8 [Striga hermonthica]|uniref:Cysteine-rich RLK (RECEPTOR-like protein kinase) 8 n=1 Tax=Striga hermonthica TaxID=68872 RepID=A0A9N7RPJ6_STRHE|nr:cysteine-rich RLK (RECEPTOR-like protein kinase) 8 [Striga hermonthica]
MFRTFGCLCYAKKLGTYNKKFDERAAACVFLGYVSGTKGYGVYNLETKEIFISRDVIFYETKFPFCQVVSTSTEPAVSLPVIDDDEDMGDVTQEHTQKTPEVNSDNETLRRSSRCKKPPSWMSDYVIDLAQAEELSLFFSEVDKTATEPLYYEQAIGDQRWIDAMHKELDALESNNTWILTKLPAGKKAIGSKWDSKPTVTPLPQGMNLSSIDSPPLDHPENYRRLIGRLLYLNLSRADLSYGIQQLSQFIQAPSQAHWNATLHLVKYLNGTPNLGLYYKASPIGVK